MAEKYDGIERYIFADAYNFFLKYKDVPNDEFYWEKIIADAKMLSFKYKDHPMLRGILGDVMNQLEHVINDKPLNKLTHEEWEKKLSLAHKIGW